ncbi:MAG: hypothetical protein K9W46_05405 [Candidatus Heimdallarchaeum endolithica]|uniref:DZANK-type domain-containing protein n=1 Tax=Candidatus Heimdallarchaeum endolithica TaxID=2876572 RepID=A0A9Y1BUX4_9ARCH|nr:MAG: hypothetical protein K9W46_05405 [Candidatus Heimdallarchaeum endolithica]
MSDEDFVRCPNCGNLNIKGSTKCLFCDQELEVSEEDKGKVVETFPCPSCSTDLPVGVKSCPICGWSEEGASQVEEGPTDKGESLGIPQVGESAPPAPTIPKMPETEEEGEEVLTPKIPDMLVEEVEKVEEEIIIEEELVQPEKVSFKFTIAFICLSLLLSIFHYGFSFLIALPSVKVIDPEVQVIPLQGDLSTAVKISAIAFYLSVVVSITSGYIISLFIRKRIKELKNIILWLGIFIFIDLIVHIAIPALATIIFYPREILFINLSGATLVFLVTNIVLMFTPFIVGGHWLFTKLDKLYFPKKHAQN